MGSKTRVMAAISAALSADREMYGPARECMALALASLFEVDMILEGERKYHAGDPCPVDPSEKAGWEHARSKRD